MLIETEFAERMIQLCRGNGFPREIHSTRGRVSTEKSRRSVTRFVQTAPVILTRDEIEMNENTAFNKDNTFNNFPLCYILPGNFVFLFHCAFRRITTGRTMNIEGAERKRLRLTGVN